MKDQKIPQQVSPEEMIKNLRESLSYYQDVERTAIRELKKEAFRMAIQIRPQTDYSARICQSSGKQYSTEDLIKSANKIYDELIK